MKAQKRHVRVLDNLANYCLLQLFSSCKFHLVCSCIVTAFGSKSRTALWSGPRVVWYPSLELVSELKRCHELLRVLNAIKKQTLGIRYVLCCLPSSRVSADAFPNRRVHRRVKAAAVSEANSSSLLFPALPRPWMSVPRNETLESVTHIRACHVLPLIVYIYICICIYIHCVYFLSLQAGGCVATRALPAFPYPPPTAPPCNVFWLPFG